MDIVTNSLMRRMKLCQPFLVQIAFGTLDLLILWIKIIMAAKWFLLWKITLTFFFPGLTVFKNQ